MIKRGVLASLLGSAGLLLLLCTAAAAEPRTWTDCTGKYTAQAEFVQMLNGEVVLEKSNSDVIAVPLERLSRADLEFLYEVQHNPPYCEFRPLVFAVSPRYARLVGIHYVHEYDPIQIGDLYDIWKGMSYLDLGGGKRLDVYYHRKLGRVRIVSVRRGDHGNDSAVGEIVESTGEINRSDALELVHRAPKPPASPPVESEADKQQPVEVQQVCPPVIRVQRIRDCRTP